MSLAAVSEGDGHLSYFSVAWTKHFNQGNSAMKVFNWAYGSTGLEFGSRSKDVRRSWESAQLGRPAGGRVGMVWAFETSGPSLTQ